MSRVIDILARLFDSRFIEESHTSIDEPAVQMCRNIVKGADLPDENILVCRLDQTSNSQITDLFPYLRKSGESNGLRGMRRICDYAIFVDKEGKLFVLLIELKKGDDSPIEQLELTEPLIRFIFERAHILNHLSPDYLIRKIGITDKVGKRTTDDRGAVVYDQRQYVKLYKNKNLYLQRLLH